MAIQENVAINFVTSYQGAQLNKAKADVTSFEKLANKAFKTFTGLFAAQKIVAFGKASVDAFTQDQKALALLDQTLKDVGLSFDSVAANDFITKLSETYGITKDQLIPAFQTLIRYTGDFAASQKLTNLALDISAGTGKDLATVSSALGKAYGGQTTALGKLGTGLSKSDLASKNFVVIQKKLSDLFKGDASAAANTYQGKIDKLKTTFHEMQVNIGQGLVDAFTKLTGSGSSVDNATKSIHDFGVEIGNAITGVGVLLGYLNSKVTDTGLLGSLEKFGKTTGLGSINPADLPIVRLLAKIGANSKKTALIDPIAAERQYQAQKALADAAATKAAKEALATALATKKAEADKLALQKAQLALKKDSKVMDMQAIEDYAALQQAQSQDDKNRLMLMQALLDQNATAATNLADKVLAANGLVMDLQGNISKDPMAQWRQSIENFNADMDAAIAKAKELESHIHPPIGGSNSTPTPTDTIGSTGLTQTALQSALSTNSFGVSLDAWTAAIQNNPVEVKVTVDPSAMAYGISMATQSTSSNGIVNNLSRNNPVYLNPSSGL